MSLTSSCLAMLTFWTLALAATLQAVPAEQDDGLDQANYISTEDLDGIIERGFLRILTVHNPLYFTFDRMSQRGIAPEVARMLEEHLAKDIGRVRSPSVVLIPVARDELLSGLLEGRGDLAMGNLTITPEREKIVDFALPVNPDIDELVITGPAAPRVSSFDDLVRTGLCLRKSSSYFEHAQALNVERSRQGKEPIPITQADEYLEDYDLLDMVNAGVVKAIVVDSHKAALWGQVLPNIVVHKDLALHTGNQIAWALRKGNPKLLATVNSFAKTIRKGTLLGNIVIKRYFGNTEWIENALADEDRSRYEETVDVIKKYSDRYEFDWLVIAAQAYQESRFDQSKRSSAGAVGIMQLLPSTAADPAVGIPDISSVENNVHAGVRYLRWLRDTYYSAPEIEPLDRVLFSFAAYNAGPGNMNRARKKTEKLGFDPNRWFGNVEIGMYRAVSGEPASYVRNIYKYYVTYRGLEHTRQERRDALEE